MTLDEVVPHPQYRMCHARTVSAPPAVVWDELSQVTMSALPLGYALESIRLLPARLAGRRHRPLAGVAATDQRTQRLFAAYWLFIRPGSGAIRCEVLRVIGGRAQSPRTSADTTASASTP